MAPPDSYMTHGILFGQICLLLFGQKWLWRIRE
jgi:hypothetical protein